MRWCLVGLYIGMEYVKMFQTGIQVKDSYIEDIWIFLHGSLPTVETLGSPIAEVCAPRNDVNIFYSPSSCAKSLFPKWEAWTCKKPWHPITEEKNHLKNGASVPCKACFWGKLIPLLWLYILPGWELYFFGRKVGEGSASNCTPSGTELQMVLWWFSIVLLTLALRTSEWFILAVGSQDYSRDTC